jgi:hypothetical protein
VIRVLAAALCLCALACRGGARERQAELLQKVEAQHRENTPPASPSDTYKDPLVSCVPVKYRGMESGGLTFLVVVSNDCNQDIQGVSGTATVITRSRKTERFDFDIPLHVASATSVEHRLQNGIPRWDANDEPAMVIFSVTRVEHAARMP